MINNWKTYKLWEFLEIKNGKTKPKEIGDIPIYGGNGILGFTNKSNVNKDVLIIGRVGAYCGTVYFEDKPVWISDNALYTFPKKEDNLKFIYYLLKQLDLNQFASGSSQPLLTQDTLNRIEVTFPPLQEQKSIASILYTIDDKIENNLAINKTLEEMAMALYKHWFVDFGPFQDGEFVESEIFGLNNYISIPKNFKILNIKEEITRLKPVNKYIKDNVLKLGKVRVYDQSSARILGFHNNEPDFEADFENPLLIFGDHTCRMELICENFSVGPNLIPFKTNVKDYTYLVYLALKDKVKMNDYKRHWSELMLHQFVVPNEINLLIDFNNIVKELFNLINKNEIENQTLTQLRDTLLPKFISGEVRLKEFREN